MSDRPLTHAERGRLGGLATLRKHGRDHFSRIGEKGAIAFHRRYHLSPINRNDFAIVERATGKVIATLLGSPFDPRIRME